MTGQVFDIKKFAIHDGPGIRTTLFLKGCLLKCVWCHNPEGIEREPRLWFFDKKCIQCGTCLETCPEGALSKREEGPFIQIDHEKCISCGQCVEQCPTSALVYDSYTLTVEEAVDKLLQDQAFYTESKGGVTISGGDPLYQHRFSTEVLKTCHDQGIHTAIETSMQGAQSVLESFIPHVDLFIVDLKLMDTASHKEHAAIGNEQILKNFAFLVEKDVEILVRIPLIPTITATEENIRNIGRFVRKTSSSVPVELINFNPLAENKYRLMGKEFQWLSEMKPFSKEEMDRFYAILEEEGVQIVREQALD